jgi:large subunit ribosomal protein L12e
VGPLGVPAKKVQEDIAKASMGFKGLRVKVMLTIQNRQAGVVVVPSTATLIIKAFNKPPRDRKKEKNIKHDGNLALETIVDIARQVRARSLARELAGTVREVLGTCSSMGCTVGGMNPRELSQKIKAGEVAVPAK